MCRPFIRFGAGPKCARKVHQTTAPEGTRQVRQHWSESLGQGGAHLEKQGSIKKGKHPTQDALEAAWEHDGHLGRASATSPTIWDASPSCGDILITNHPTNQPTKEPSKGADASFSAGAVLVLDDSGERLEHRIKATCNYSRCRKINNNPLCFSFGD